jgi:DNA-directed RNA polymerase I, II, and III subunit RPABC3
VDWVLTRNRKYYASFGGLLLYMEGPHRKLNGLKIDDIYMLLKHS